MTAATGDTRTTGWTRFALPLAFATTALLGVAGAAASQTSAVAPTALGAAASATPQVQPPAAPQPLVVAPPPAGSAGPAVARGEGKVAAGRPVTFLLKPETGGMFSIGVSSPQNAARITIYVGESTQPAAGTTAAEGAIRWSSDLVAAETVKIVVYTAGAEIPFRVEAVAGAGGL